MNNSFLMALGRHDGGNLADEAAELQRQCARAALTRGKPAKLTVEITFKPNGENALELSIGLKATLPKSDHGSAFYWPTEEFDLTRTPPKEEADLLLRSIPSGAAKA